MAENIRFIFSGTLVLPNIFRLRLIRALSNAWFAQNKILTEVNLAISGVHFLFTAIFQYLNFVRFRSYSKLKFSYRCSLQWWKPFVDIFFHLREISKHTLGNIKKTGLILSSERERKYANTWGGGGRASGRNSFQNHSYSIPFVFITFCVHSAFTFMRF